MLIPTEMMRLEAAGGQRGSMDDRVRHVFDGRRAEKLPREIEPIVVPRTDAHFNSVLPLAGSKPSVGVTARPKGRSGPRRGRCGPLR